MFDHGPEWRAKLPERPEMIMGPIKVSNAGREIFVKSVR